ncbi:hypothetical protein ETU09_05330 [Apibacter muscae]|uniref:OmpA-like domain-containing protein n=1 Tax=Apibacter muscae TaxID=2509004 RepID=A0A563DEL2_9FLAO|nr:OmpA family protein [Apibacter muscae]TWP28738.1 hypothetical protein ETU09_05330 [Apibacter muscae]
MKKIGISIFILVALTACVPQAKYKDLEKKYYAALQGESKNKQEIEAREADLKALTDQFSSLQAQQEALAQKKVQLDNEYADLQIEYTNKLKDLEDLKNKNSQISETALKEKQKIEGELAQAQGQLNQKIQRINELEGLINQQKESVSLLKKNLQTALKSYEGKGISVEEKDGYIYISMDNKLLFPSASWTVEAQGLKALHELSKVLAKDKNLNIIIQGHTDSDKYVGNGNIKDNWDLSVMRATAITKILQSEGISPEKMTASGRSQYAPIASNSNPTSKALNRRVDIIIAPNLSEINKLLNQL